MRAVIDKAGRVVVPKPLRDELGLMPGTELEIAAIDGRLEMSVPPVEMNLEDGPDGPRLAAGLDMPPLDDSVVRATLERVRR